MFHHPLGHCSGASDQRTSYLREAAVGTRSAINTATSSLSRTKGFCALLMVARSSEDCSWTSHERITTSQISDSLNQREEQYRKAHPEWFTEEDYELAVGTRVEYASK